MKYSRDFLIAQNKPGSETDTFDFTFLSDPFFRDLIPRKRGRRGGVRIRNRRRRLRLPLPSIIVGNAQSLGNKCDELAACCRYMHEFREASVLCFSESWLRETDADPDIPGFSVFRCDRSAENTGKSRGGGVCLFVNDRWCTNVTVKESFCHSEIELLTVALRPFYLPREFNQIYVTVVYIHPRANTKVAAELLSDVIHRMSSLSPDAPSFIAGDFNSCRLSKVLPTFKQYVTCTTCGNSTLDLCYGNIKGAFKSRPLPNLGRSVHQMIQLIPVYRQKLKQSKPIIRNIKVWNDESAEKLNACFDCTDWDIFLDDNSPLDAATDVISSYINFCVDLVLESKQIKLFPNSKPWVTSELRSLLRDRQSAVSQKDTDKKKNLQKRIDKKIAAEKKRYAAKLEDNFKKGDSKQCWNNLSTITGHKPKRTAVQSDDPTKLADELNVFYTRFDRQDFNRQQQQAMDEVRQLPALPVTISEDKVRDIFRRLNAKSASGPDCIASKTLKTCSSSLAYVFKV